MDAISLGQKSNSAAMVSMMNSLRGRGN
jgi:hypothetical protein